MIQKALIHSDIWGGGGTPTALAPDTAESIHCSFCKRPGDDLQYMILNGSIAICNLCVGACCQMVVDAGYPLTVRRNAQ